VSPQQAATGALMNPLSSSGTTVVNSTTPVNGNVASTNGTNVSGVAAVPGSGFPVGYGTAGYGAMPAGDHSTLSSAAGPRVGTGPNVGTGPSVGTGPDVGTGPAVGTGANVGTGPSIGLDGGI